MQAAADGGGGRAMSEGKQREKGKKGKDANVNEKKTSKVMRAVVS